MSDENTTEMTELERALEIVDPIIEANGPDEDLMIVALIQGGFKYAKANRIMVAALESKNLRMSSRDRYAAVEELLSLWGFKPESWDDVQTAASSLTEEVEATDLGQAIRAIKKFAKQNHIELPAKPRGGGGGSRVNANSRFYAWAVGNRDATEEDVARFVADLGVTEKQAGKYVAFFNGALDFARNFAS